MKLSIIVPVYNLENDASKTLDSLLSIRFYHDYEVIVVNDGSTDGSAAVIAVYQEKTDKIRLFSIENRGPGTMASAKRWESISPMWMVMTR